MNLSTRRTQESIIETERFHYGNNDAEFSEFLENMIFFMTKFSDSFCLELVTGVNDLCVFLIYLVFFCVKSFK